jgi:hypothetical protein
MLAARIAVPDAYNATQTIIAANGIAPRISLRRMAITAIPKLIAETASKTHVVRPGENSTIDCHNGENYIL